MDGIDRPGASASMARAAASSSLAGHAADARLIRRRPRVGIIAAVVLAALFCAGATAIAVAERLAPLAIADGEPAPVTVRAPLFSGAVVGDRLISGGLVLARGQTPDAGVAALASAIQRRHTGAAPLLAGILGGLALLLVVSMRLAHRGRLLRAQLVVLAATLAWLAAAKVALLASPVSALALPAASLAMIAGAVIGRRVAPLVGLAGGAALALLVPLDGGVIAVLAAQGLVAGAVIAWRGPSFAAVLGAALAGAVAAVGAAIAASLAANGAVSLAAGDPLRAQVTAAAIGGLAAAPLALIATPLLARLSGEPSPRRLIALQDFSNALLQDIAGRAPGTWQHSLAMASMVEAAVEAIGGDAILARAGAYYHDLGKSLQPKYFAENLAGGEPSALDSLDPELAAGVLAAHVTEGVRIGRRAGLPERVVDFMHMHHGGELIERPWARYQAAGGGPLGEDAFRYPGVLPQTRETGVLAICDAVERATRDLANVDATAVRSLVQEVIAGKVASGQLAESGLQADDLETIGAVLCQVIAVGAGERPQPSSSRQSIATIALRKNAPEPAALAREMERGRAPEPAPEPERKTPPPPPGPDITPNTRPMRPTQLGVEAPPHAPDSSVKIAAPAPAPEPEPAPDDDLDVDATNPLAPRVTPPPPPRRRSPRTEQLSEWEHALEVVSDDPAATTPPRPKPDTIELLGDSNRADTEKDPGPPEPEVPLNATSLSPGTLVIGPPPETHPDNAFGDHTVERRLPIPREGIRPSKRRTEEREVVVPPEAFPDKTEPNAVIIRPRRRDETE